MVDDKSAYKSFSQKYKKVEDLEGLTDLNLTPREGFELKQIYDLNELGSLLVIVLRIDLSNNYLSKLHLKNIPNLQKLYARQNMINECNLILPKLRILELSANLLKEIPNLSNLPELVELDLSKNLLAKVAANDFLPIKKTLEILKLSFNRIQFPSVNDFISFIDGIKFYQIKELSIEGNEFTRTNQILANSYKMLIVLALKNLYKLNGEPKVIVNDLVNEEEIKQQMLHEEEYLNKTKKSFYSSFSQAYNDVSVMEKLTKLELIPFKSFFLKSIDDLLNYSRSFTQLTYLNISENLLQELTIGVFEEDFPVLQIIKASKNNIDKVQIGNLPSLIKLDLSYNQLKALPDLNEITGPLESLILSYNKIAVIDCNKIALMNFITEFNLSGNLIDFTKEKEICALFSNEFDKLAGLNYRKDHKKRFSQKKVSEQPQASLAKFQLLTVLNVNDNPFCSRISLFKYFAEKLADEFDSSRFQLNDLNLKTIYNQLKDLEEKNRGQKLTLASIIVPIEEEKKVSSGNDNANDGLENRFASLNNILERLISFNGNNQILYFEFLSDLNMILDQVQQDTCDLLELKLTYETFLMNCNELITLNPNYEIQTLKALSQLALYPKFNICKYTLDYLKMYVSSDEVKKSLIKEIIENIIIKTLQTNNFIPLDIISALLSFFKDTNLSSHLLYKSMILSIVRFIAQNEKKVKALQGKKAKDFFNSLHFVINYLEAEDQSEYHINTHSAHEDDKPNANGDEDSDTSSELSLDPAVDRTNDTLIYDVLYEEKICSILKSDFVLESVNSEVSLLNVFRTCEKYYECFNLSNFIPVKIMGYDIFNKIANDHSLVMLQMTTPGNRRNFEFLIYCYIFLNIFKIAYSFLIDIRRYFHKIPLPNEDLGLKGKKLFKIIKILNSLLANFKVKKYPFNYMLKHCDIESILDSLDSFIAPVLLEKKETISLDQLIGRFIFNQPSISPSLSVHVKEFYHNLPILFDCIGSLIAFLPEGIYFKKIESPMLEKYFAILTSTKVDPYILCGTCMLMTRIISCSYFMQNDLNMSTVFSRVKNFRNMLHFIDYANEQYRSIIDSLLNEEDIKVINENPYDFNVISLDSILDFFFAVINIFVTISKFGLKSKLVQSVLEDLKERRMYDILGNCLKIIKNDEIRKKAIECFFCVDHKSITNENIILIIDIVSKYSSILEGEIEYIISIIFLTLNKKLSTMIEEMDNNTFASMKLAVNAAVKFIGQNTERFASDSELEEKNTLSASLIIFLSTASRSPVLFSDIFEESDKFSSFILFKKIMTNDLTYINEEYYIPVQIERTHFGCYLPILLETMEGYNCLKTYSYPFLRVLIKVADILCRCDEFSFELLTFEELEKLFKKLSEHVNSRFNQIICNETKDWYSFQTNCQRTKTKQIPYYLSKTIENTSFDFAVKDDPSNQDEHYTSVLNSRIAELVPFDINEYYPEQYPDMSISELITQHATFLISFPSLLVFLLGKKTNILEESIADELSVKYYQPIVHSEKILQLFKHYKANGKINTIMGEIKHFESEIPFSNPVSKTAMSKLKSVNIDSLLKISNLISYASQAKSESIVNEYLTFENDMSKYELYGIDMDSKRLKREENVNNPHLRSLSINALLRCIYAILISPSQVIRNDFIEYLFIGNKYKEILLYANTARFYQNYNLYTIIQELFSTKNLPKLIEACSYSNTKPKSSNNKVKALNDIIFPSNNSNDKQKDKKSNETELFHQFFITATFLEKEIKLKATKYKDNFLFIYNFELCIFSFLNSYSQINFRVIDSYFRSLFITRRLCLSEHYNMIFTLNEQLNYYSAEVFNTIKELRNTYIKYQNDFLSYGIGENEELRSYILDKENALIEFLAMNELNKKKITELLALLIAIDSDSQNEIFFNCLRLAEERDSIEKILKKHSRKEDNEDNNDNVNNKSNNNATDDNVPDINGLGDTSHTKVKEREIAVQVTELMDKLITIHMKNKILFEFEKDDITIINSYIVTEIKGLVAVNKNYFLTINRLNVKLYPIEGQAKIVNTNTKEIPMISISKLLLYDTTRIVLIILANSDIIKLQFTSMIYSSSFIDEIKQCNPLIGLFYSDDLKKKLQSTEDSDERLRTHLREVNDRIKEKDSNKRENAKIYIWKQIKPVLDKAEHYRFTNSIEENFYYKAKRDSKHYSNVFYIDNLDKILVLNPFYMYVVSEKNMFVNQIKPQFNEDGIEFNKDSLWKIEEKVLYTDIKRVNSDFLEKEMYMVYKNVENKKKMVVFKFKEKFELYLLNVRLLNINEMVRDGWNTERKNTKYATKKK